LRVGDALRAAADRETANFLPTRIGQVDGERDLPDAGKVFRLLRFRRAAKIDLETVVDIADGRGLRITVLPDSRDRYVYCVVED